jgi:hypothetical protein
MPKFLQKNKTMKKVIFLITLSILCSHIVKAQSLTHQSQSSLDIKSVVHHSDSTKMQEYSGKYTMEDNPYIEEVVLKVKDDKLISTTPEGEEVVFQYVENDEFFISDFNLKVNFIRENGIVKSVKVHIQGKELVGEKK